MDKNFKGSVLTHVKKLLDEKLVKFQNELRQLQKSSNEETKSSMGDKYETGRAMVMQEQEKMADQIEQVQGQLRMLNAINLTKDFVEAQFGAMIITKLGVYFISISYGILEFKKQKVFMISANAPVAQAMLGKSKGDEFILNGRKIEIQKIV